MSARLAHTLVATLIMHSVICFDDATILQGQDTVSTVEDPVVVVTSNVVVPRASPMRSEGRRHPPHYLYPRRLWARR